MQTDSPSKGHVLYRLEHGQDGGGNTQSRKPVIRYGEDDDEVQEERGDLAHADFSHETEHGDPIPLDRLV